jgi:two-component system chemotaxis response regulator CheY
MNAGAPTGRRRIVIADDSFDSRQILARLLRQYVDADIVETRNGVDAWTECQRIKPQITFLDIDMPGRDGLEVLSDIRADDPKAFVVLVSGLSAVETVMKAISLGAGGFVVKPYAAQRILDVLQKYVADTEDAGALTCTL